jgi:hypothetical protein
MGEWETYDDLGVHGGRVELVEDGARLRLEVDWDRNLVGGVAAGSLQAAVEADPVVRGQSRGYALVHGELGVG